MNVEEKEEEERSSLIPGLSDEITVNYIFPRIPWDQRPGLMLLSKAWLLMLQTPFIYNDKVRHVFRQEGIVVVHHKTRTKFSDEYDYLKSDEFELDKAFEALPFCDDSRTFVLYFYHPLCATWQELPPLPDHQSHNHMVCVEGKLFVIGRDAQDQMYLISTLDLGAGVFRWRKVLDLPSFEPFTRCLAVKGKLYIYGPNVYYDSQQDAWTRFPKWDHYFVRDFLTLHRYDYVNGVSYEGRLLILKDLHVSEFLEPYEYYWRGGYSYNSNCETKSYTRRIGALYDESEGKWKEIEEEGDLWSGLSSQSIWVEKENKWFELRDGEMYMYSGFKGWWRKIPGSIPHHVNTSKDNKWCTDGLVALMAREDREIWFYALVREYEDGECLLRKEFETALWRGRLELQSKCGYMMMSWEKMKLVDACCMLEAFNTTFRDLITIYS
eukprot:Gb_24137 [translate_table: standard]